MIVFMLGDERLAHYLYKGVILLLFSNFFRFSKIKTIALMVLFMLPYSDYVFALTDEEANTFAQQAYEEAVRLARVSNIEMASLYFVNALAFNPGRLDIITDYTSMILGSVKNNNTEIPLDMLDAIDNFLNLQATTVKPQDIPQIVKLREIVSDTREELNSKVVPQVALMSNNRTELEVRKYKNKANQARKLNDFIKCLDDAQKLLDSNGKTDDEVTETLQIARVLDEGIKQISDLMRLVDERELEAFHMYYLQLMESSLQQLVILGSRLPRQIYVELLTVKDNVDRKVNEISEAHSATVLAQIRDEYEELIQRERRFDTEQQKINALNIFVQDITIRAQQITFKKSADEFRMMMEEIQRQLLSYHTEQEKKYNDWAMDEIKDMLTEVGEYGDTIVKDKKAIGNIMISHFARIDTRLLNFGAQNCFNTAYQEYYQKLDKEMRRLVDKAMAFDKKRDLSDF